MFMSEALTLEELVEKSDLSSFTYFEVSAVRSDSAVANELSETDRDIKPNHLLQTAPREDDSGFRVRIRTEIDAHVGTIVVDVAAEYELTEAVASSFDPVVLTSFVNNVAVMTLFPYIRQAVADITLRVFGAALTMPVVRRGELAFDPPKLVEQPA
jgi:hypothetical protein